MADIITTYHNSKVKPKIQEIVGQITTLNGNDTVSGSVDKKIKDALNAFATAITDDGTINTYAEVLNWIATHGAEFAELVGDVNTNTGNINTLDDQLRTAESNITALSNELSSLDGDIDDIANGSTTITPTLSNNTTYGNITLGANALTLSNNTYGFTSLLSMANVLANLRNGFAYNSDDSEWYFTGAVLNFGSGDSGVIYLDDQNALKMNTSSYSGYGSLAAMATALSGAVANIATIAASIPTTATINALTWD